MSKLLKALKQDKVDRILQRSSRKEKKELEYEGLNLVDDIDKNERDLHMLDGLEDDFAQGTQEEESEFEDTKKQIEGELNYEQHNIATVLPEGTFDKLVNDIYQKVEMDIESKREWQDIINTAKDQFNFTIDDEEQSVRSSDGMGYKRLSKDKSYMMNWALVQNSAILDSKFLTPDSMVNFVVEDDDLKPQVNLLKKYFNNYLVNSQKDYIEDKRNSFSHYSFAGVVFWKVHFDPIKNLCVSYYISAENIDMDATAKSLDDATRVSYKMLLSDQDIEERIQAGIFLDRNYQHSMEDDANNDILNKVDATEEIIKYFKTFREVQIHVDLSQYGSLGEYEPKKAGPLPYTLIMDWNGRKGASLVEAWRAGDTQFKRKDKLVKATYFPSLDFWPYGMAHLVAPQVKASTNFLRLIANAATFSSYPTVMINASVKNTQNNILLEPGSMIPVTTTDTEPLANNVIPLPFKEPSPFLDTIRQYYDDGALKVITSLNELMNVNPNTPATNIIAILQEASRVPNFIIKNLYEAFTREFKIYLDHLKEYADFIDPEYMPDEFKQLLQELDLSSIQIMPAANPDISTQYTDMIKYDSILNMLDRYPDSFNQMAVVRKWLETLGINNIDELLNNPEETKPMTPLMENVAVRNGVEIKVFKTQEHFAHKIVHLAEIEALTQDMEMPPEDKQRRLNALISHIDNHTFFENVRKLEQEWGQDLGDEEDLDENIQNQLALLEAEEVEQNNARIAEEKANQPPQPTEIDILSREAETEAKRVEVEAMKADKQSEIDMMRIQTDLKIAAIKLEMEEKHNQSKLEVELLKSKMKQDADMAKLDSSSDKNLADFILEFRKANEDTQMKLADLHQKMQAPKSQIITN
jgi:hypothetical protein